MSKTRKIFATLTIVAVATAVSLTAVSSAQASHRHHHRGNVALGVLGGLAAGVIIGSSRRDTYSGPVRRRSARGSHVNWCDRRYRSYDPYTDTWIDLRGRERYCISPYR